MKRGNINTVLKEQLEIVKPSKEDQNRINKTAKDFQKKLREKLKNKNIKADVFIGGSLAKGTLVKKDIYDIDIFIRFDLKYSDKEISKLLGSVLGNTAKKVHGSRDYYQIKSEDILIEIIPVLKITTPLGAMNVTDLSYFHVNYLVKRIKSDKKLADEIRLAKAFAYAQNVYGAESYIHGFSGYALELLIVHYKSFQKFIKEIAKTNITKNNKITIDTKGFFKNNKSIIEETNPSKITGPIIIIDPTFSERNAGSSLSHQTLNKFKEACKKFLNNPSKKFFELQDTESEFKKHKEVKILKIRTNKQPGDIAGTKSKKFFKFFYNQLNKEFEIKKSGFDYDDINNLAKFYFIPAPKLDEIKRGPPVTAVHHLTGFKKAHPSAFIKDGFAHIKVKHSLSFEEWFKIFLKKEKKVIGEMGIVSVGV